MVIEMDQYRFTITLLNNMTTQELKIFLKKLVIHLNEENRSENYYILVQWESMNHFFVVLKNKAESIVHDYGRATDDIVFDELENLTLRRFILSTYIAGIAKPFIKEHCSELLKQGQIS